MRPLLSKGTDRTKIGGCYPVIKKRRIGNDSPWVVEVRFLAASNDCKIDSYGNKNFKTLFKNILTR